MTLRSSYSSSSGGGLFFERLAPLSVAALGAIAMGLADGGFFARTWAPTIVAFAAAVELALLMFAQIELSRFELTVLGLLGAFVGWSALSTLWSADPSASLREAERALLYLLALLAMLLLTRRGYSGALICGVLVAATVVSAYGLIEYLVARSPLDPAEGALLFQPIGYANAAGILAALGVIIACGLALYALSAMQAVVWASPLVVLVPTLALTQSRGSWAAVAVGVVILIAVRFSLGRVQVIALLAALALAGGIVVWSSGHGFFGNRPTYWHVAWHEYQANAVLGSGAGTYVHAWSTALPRSLNAARDAHNLYLESLAEVGPIGLGLLLATLGLPLLALRRDRMAAVAGAAYLAFLVHAGIDWDWEMPAVTLAGLGCAAALLVEQRSDASAVSISARWRLVTALSAAAVAIALVVVTALV